MKVKLDLNDFKKGKKIFDSIHGTVHLADYEIRIINTPQFQRLRRIQQLGFASLVFPEANHTRFSHSIGVLAVMDRLCLHLKVSKKDRCLLRLIALLHDIGHYPFSHTIENVYRSFEKKEVDKGFEYELLLEGSKQNYGTNINSETNKSKINLNHEYISKTVARQVLDATLDDKLDDDAKDAICDSIIGNGPFNYFNQLIKSHIDADNMDYLLRDSSKTGIPYGNYDFNYLSESFTKIKIPKKVRDKADIGKKMECIVIDLKGLNALEHFYLAKYYWYTQILFHRALSIMEYIAQRIAFHLIELNDKEGDFVYGEGLPSYKQWLKIVEDSKNDRFIHLDDNYFFEQVKKVLLNKNENLKMRQLCASLCFRVVPNTIQEKRLFIGSTEEDQLKIEKLKEKFASLSSHNNSEASFSIYKKAQWKESLSDYFYRFRSIMDKEGGRVDTKDELAIFTARDTPTIRYDSKRYVSKNMNQPICRSLKKTYTLLRDFEDTFLHEMQKKTLHVFRIYDFQKFDVDTKEILNKLT